MTTYQKALISNAWGTSEVDVDFGSNEALMFTTLDAI
jgi:hypothetical protein